VQALLQPNYSSCQIKETKDYTQKNTDIKDLINDRKYNAKSEVYAVDQNMQILKVLANDINTNFKSNKQSSAERRKVDVYKSRRSINKLVTAVRKMDKHKNISFGKQIKRLFNLKKIQLNNKPIHMHYNIVLWRFNLEKILEIIKQLNILMSILNIKIYLFIKSHIILYNKYKMKANDRSIDINWKTNQEIYKTISTYDHFIDINRMYFITWKLQSLILKEKLTYKTILWHFVEKNSIYEDIITKEIEQNGDKVKIIISDTNRNYDTIWITGKRIELDARTMIKYMEIEDLIESNHKELFPPNENTKFKKKMLNLDANTCIRNGIIINDYEVQLYMLLEEMEEEDSDSNS
jgi:hypothetical protein